MKIDKLSQPFEFRVRGPRGGRVESRSELLNGRYRLGEAAAAVGAEVGATDELSGAEVVIRLLEEERPDGVSGRILHPGLARVLERGRVERGPADLRGRSFLVREAVPGRTLRDAMDADGRLDPGTIGRVALEALGALEALEALGVRHGALTPERIVLLPTGEVKLTDAGAVALAGDSPYAAPELLRGGAPDARADLYALGVCLYEAAAGRVPDRAAPIPLRELRPDVPASVERAVGQLLHAEPRARGEGAAEARQLFAGGMGVAPPQAGAGSVEPTFVGRADELTALEGALEEAQALAAAGRAAREAAPDEQPTFVLLRGAEGLGKTRLLGEAAGRLLRGGARVLQLQGFQGGDPYSSWRQALERTAGGGDAGLRDAALAALSGGTGGDQARRERVARYLLDLAATCPLALLVDDAHLLGAPSAALLVHVARAAAAPGSGGALMTAAALRPRRPADPPPLDAELAAPLAPATAERSLPELSEDEARALVASVLPDDAAAVDDVVRLGGGSPFVLVELAREHRSGGGTPASVQDALRARVERASPGARRLLEGLAVLGRPVEPPLVAALGGEAAADAARELRALGLLAGDDERGLALRHGVTRPVVLEALGDAELQAACGRALAALGDSASPGERARIALMAQRDDAADLALAAAPADPSPEVLYAGALELLPAGPERAAVEVRLADRLRELGELAEARRALESALLDLGDAPPAARVVPVHLGLARLAMAEGDTHEALLHTGRGRQAIGDAPADAALATTLAELFVVEGKVAILRSDHAGAVRLLSRAKEAARHDAVLQARILIEEGMALVLSLDRSRYAEAEELLLGARRTLAEAGEGHAEVEAIRGLGNHAYYSGDKAKAEAFFREGLAACEAHPDPLLAAGLWNNVGLVCRDQGDLRRAEAALERALDIAERVGQGSVLCRAFTNVGRVRASLGDHRGAQRSFQRAAAVAREIGEAMIESAALAELGAARHAEGRTKAALGAYGRALRLRLTLGDRGRVAESELQLGEVWRAAGDVRAALGCTLRALALQSTLGDPDGVAMAVEAMEFAVGRPGGPAALLSAARRRLKPRGPAPIREGLEQGAAMGRLALRTLAAALTARAGAPDQAATHEARARKAAARVAGREHLPEAVRDLARALALEAEAVVLAGRGDASAARDRVEEALALAPAGSVRRGALLLKRAFLELALGRPAEAVRDALAEPEPEGLPAPLRERRAVGRALVVAMARRRGAEAPAEGVGSLAEAEATARRLGDVALHALVASARAEEAQLSGDRREGDTQRAAARIAAGRLAAGLPDSLAAGLERASAPAGGPAAEDVPAAAAAGGGELLGMLSRVLNSGLDLESLLASALDALIEATGARRGVAALRGGEGPDCRVLRGLEAALPATTRAAAEHALREGHPVLVADAEADPRFGRPEGEADPRSLLAVPLAAGGRTAAVLYVDDPARAGALGPAERDLGLAFAAQVAGPIAGSLQRAEQVGELSRLAEAYRETARELGHDEGTTRLIGRSQPIRVVHRLIERYGRTSAPVTVFGESGTGKELVARALHFASPRRDGPFVALNCSALNDSLLESELFGVIKGAYTGADRDRKGLFELAHEGTLFLDEVGDMSLDMQARLLRVLETGELRPVGGRRIVKVDVRIVSASHRDLRALIAEGRFREDLLYRLNVLRLELPPLRERLEDLPLLADHFLAEAAAGGSEPPKQLAKEALAALMRHRFPGNVRELKNALERACVLEPGPVIGPDKLLLDAPRGGPGSAPTRGAPPDYHKTFEYQGVALNRRQRQLLEHLATGVAAITNREYCGMTNVSERTGLRDLTHLVEQGLLVRLGKRKGARYQLNEAPAEA